MNKPGYWKDWYENKGGRARVMAGVKQWRVDNPHRYAFASKKSEARRKGIEFSLVFEDLSFPTHCPVLGIELNYIYGTKGSAPTDASPSFDRIDNSKGYVKGNVIVVSQLANRIKTSATPEQIARVADFYAALHAAAASESVGTTSE